MSVLSNQFITMATLAKDASPVIAGQFETVCRTLLHGPYVARSDGFIQAITGEPHPLCNFAYIADPSDLVQTQRAIEPLLAQPVPSSVVFPRHASAEVDALIVARGFVLAEKMAAMAVEIDALPKTQLFDGYSFVEIDPDADRERWCEVFGAGYGIPPLVAHAFGPPTGPATKNDAQARYFAVKRGNDFVATSMVYLEGGLAGIYCVSTIPVERGRGLGAFATAEPLRRVRSLGYRTGILQASAMGEPVYRRLGFNSFGFLPLYVRTPADGTAPH